MFSVLKSGHKKGVKPFDVISTYFYRGCLEKPCKQISEERFTPLRELTVFLFPFTWQVFQTMR